MTTATQTEATPKERITQWAEKHGATMAVEFVPLSRSRNAGEKFPTLNWKVTIQRNGRNVLTTDYSAGCAHCPADKMKVEGGAYHRRNVKEGAIAWECEHGKSSQGRKPILPDFVNVLWSLSMDYSVLDAGGFESWAGDLGYYTDSRKAESIYQACIEIALALRGAFGDAGMVELAEAGQDY